MTKAEFLQYINQQVKHYQLSWKVNRGQAFSIWYASEVLELAETEAFEAVSYDRANDKGIDLFYIDHQSERVLIGQLKFNAKGQHKAAKGELLELLHTTDWLKDPEALERDGRQDLASIARDYIDAVSNDYGTEYLYIYCGAKHKDVDDTARQFNTQEAGNVPSRTCRVVHLDLLIANHEEAIDQSTRINSAEIPLLNRFRDEEEGAFGKAVVASISGEQLRHLYEVHGDYLFARNVRLFLGSKNGRVNAGIHDTLESPTDRKNFWAYNNGVTFICDHYSLEENSISLHNFSIVNGCQTTVSIGLASKDATVNIKVLVRFIAAPEKTIDSIILYTNSQNPIRPWELNAQDKLQKKLKKELAKMPKPFLYVLRKGETHQLNSEEKPRFTRDGKLQAIPHDLNAQYLAAFRGLPAIAYKDKGKIFTTNRSNVFPPQIRPEELVLAWQAGNVASELVKSELEEAIQNDNPLRISVLKRGATFFVLAAMGIILHERNGKLFLNKLTSEVATSKKTAKRLHNYAVVALEWYVEAMGELVSQKDSVASLVRTQEGWLKILPKIRSKWKVYRLAQDVLEESLPKL